MASLEMGKESFELNNKTIDSLIGDNAIGNYALGYLIEKTSTFVVLYVGRSDTNLNKRLKDHVGEFAKCNRFKYVIQDNVKAAYYLECKNYHDFDGPDGRLLNEKHPDSPNGLLLECPYCLKEN